MKYIHECMGFKNKHDILVVPGHEFETDQPSVPKSTGLCPDCKQKYLEDLVEIKVGDRVVLKKQFTFYGSMGTEVHPVGSVGTVVRTAKNHDTGLVVGCDLKMYGGGFLPEILIKDVEVQL